VAGLEVNGFFIKLTLTLRCSIAIFRLHLISRDRATRLSASPKKALHLETFTETSFAPGARGMQRLAATRPRLSVMQSMTPAPASWCA
jgi:hypothetical protein